jgi:hypothetical protein
MAAEFVLDKKTTAALLRDSLKTIESFLSRVPKQWTHAAPDGSPDGAWSVAMNLAHLAIYEEGIAAPVLESVAAGGTGEEAVPSALESWFLKDAEAIAGQPIETLAARLRAARARQIAAVEAMPADLFNEPRTMLWSNRNGGKPLSASWVATKTFQHTWEHGNAILRVVLFSPW